MFQNCPSLAITFFSQFFMLTWDRALWADYTSNDGRQRFRWPLDQGYYKSSSQGRGEEEQWNQSSSFFQLKLFKRHLSICHLIQLLIFIISTVISLFTECCIDIKKSLWKKQKRDFWTCGFAITYTSATQKNWHELSSLSLRAMQLKIQLTFTDHK